MMRDHFWKTLCSHIFYTNTFSVSGQGTNATKMWFIGKIVIFLGKVQQKNDKTSLALVSQEVQTPSWDTVFCFHALRQLRAWFLLLRRVIDFLLIDWVWYLKCSWGACLHLSSLSYLLSQPVSHWKGFFLCCEGIFSFLSMLYDVFIIYIQGSNWAF